LLILYTKRGIAVWVVSSVLPKKQTKERRSELDDGGGLLLAAANVAFTLNRSNRWELIYLSEL